MRSSTRRREQNRRYRSAARTYVRRTRELVRKGDLDGASEMASQAASTLDRAARKGVIHKRNAARRKSRMMRALASAQRAA
jgi:small subunit ribosomal protein S20